VRVPVISLSRLDELWSIRMVLEGMAAEAAARNATRADIEALSLIQLNLGSARSAGAHTEMMLQNFEFHHKLYRLAHTSYLLPLIESLWLNVGPLLRELYKRRKASQQRADAYHGEALQALRKGEPKKVRRAIEADLAQALPPLRTIVAELEEAQQ
jgi:DNA-binding GntR family transcriptional regulator